jgi:hypothetical protein
MKVLRGVEAQAAAGAIADVGEVAERGGEVALLDVAVEVLGLARADGGDEVVEVGLRVPDLSVSFTSLTSSCFSPLKIW